MSLADFEDHLKHGASAFRCYACGDRAEQPTFLARVKNRPNPPARRGALSAIERLLGPAALTIKQFYANHDRVLMYEDSISSRWSGGEFQAAGIAFFPIGEWAEKSSEMRGELVGHGVV